MTSMIFFKDGSARLERMALFAFVMAIGLSLFAAHRSDRNQIDINSVRLNSIEQWREIHTHESARRDEIDTSIQTQLADIKDQLAEVHKTVVLNREDILADGKARR